MPPRPNARRPARVLDGAGSARPLRVFFTRFDQFKGNLLEFFSDAAGTPPERDPLYRLLSKELPFATLIPGSHETPKDWGYACIKGLYVVYVFRMIRDEEHARSSLMCAVGFVLPQSAMLLFEGLTVSDSDLFLELQEASSEVLRQIELKKKIADASSLERRAAGPVFSVDLSFLRQLLGRRLRFSPERETHFNMRFTNVCGRYTPAALDIIRTSLLLGLSVGIAAKPPISGAVDMTSLMMCLGSVQLDTLEDSVSPAVQSLARRAVSADTPEALWSYKQGKAGAASPALGGVAAGQPIQAVQSVLVTPYFLGHVGLAGIAIAELFLGSPDYVFGPAAAELCAEARAKARAKSSAQGSSSGTGREEETELLESSPTASTVLTRTSDARSPVSGLLDGVEEPPAGERPAKMSTHPLPREHPLKPVFMSGLAGLVDGERRSVLLSGAIGVSVEHSMMAQMFDVVVLDGVAPTAMTLKAKRGAYFVKTATPQVLVSNAVHARFPFLAQKRKPSVLFRSILGFRAASGNLTSDDANAVIQLNTNLYNNLWSAARGQIPLTDVSVGTGLSASGAELDALAAYLVGRRLPISGRGCCG